MDQIHPRAKVDQRIRERFPIRCSRWIPWNAPRGAAWACLVGMMSVVSPVAVDVPAVVVDAHGIVVVVVVAKALHSVEEDLHPSYHHLVDLEGKSVQIVEPVAAVVEAVGTPPRYVVERVVETAYYWDDSFRVLPDILVVGMEEVVAAEDDEADH